MEETPQAMCGRTMGIPQVMCETTTDIPQAMCGRTTDILQAMCERTTDKDGLQGYSSSSGRRGSRQELFSLDEIHYLGFLYKQLGFEMRLKIHLVTVTSLST